MPLSLQGGLAHAAQASYNVVDDTAGHVTADALPTAQIDSGVVRITAIAGDVVFAGGEFSNARPAGAQPGTSLVPRANLMAFSLSTGALNTTWAPTTNGAVYAMALSPDKKVLYIGGSFTQVNGQARSNIAAVSVDTGQLLSFAPQANAVVQTIVTSSTAVYFGGSFTQVNGQSRPYLAATTPAGALTAWSPVADYTVRGLALSPDGTRIIAGGAFSQMNGSFSPGLASIDAVYGTTYPFAANQTIQNYGKSSAIYSLKSDGTNILATGYWFGGVGNFEGVALIDPYSGSINWMADCHGDSYDATTLNGVVYSVSHHHDCSNINTQPQQNPWAYQRADSWTYDATTTVGPNTGGGYHDFQGQPAPSEYAWYPTLSAGTYTGATQAAWTANSSGDYVVLGGEFPRVNGAVQQGLVRFTTPAKAPNRSGPVLTAAQMQPTATAVGNAVSVSWPSSWDRDNQHLTYSLYRNDKGSTPIFTTSSTSQWWNLPALGYLDTELATNHAYTYTVVVTDANGNKVTSTPVTVTTGATAIDQSPYAKAVAADGASHYWRLTEPTGSNRIIDWVGDDNLTVGSGVTLGQDGFMSASQDTAASFDGTANGRAVATQRETGPQTMTAETWIRTTSTTGGKVLGFGDSSTVADSGNYDRQVYLDNDGHVVWGTNGGGIHTLVSPTSYNDGQWHQIVVTLSSTGTTLYVDGIKQGQDTSENSAQSFNGFWHLGGDNLNGWPSAPSSSNFTGTIDDTSIYPTALTQDQIRAHYAASGRTVDLPQRPSDSYGSSVYDDNPEFYWRLDEASGQTAKDATQNLNNGTYAGGVGMAQSSAVEGTSVLFNGQDAGVHTTSAVPAPDTYSEEAWFNTTSTTGGKIIGFGNQATGYSGSYDRHVYMDAQGHLNFGVWTGQANVITTTGSYNDGAWHHVVATQGATGMVLYVDGVKAGTNATSTGQAYSGYWRVGGDSTWSGNPYFNGLIDEAAVYDKALTLDQVRDHYRAAATTHNQAPTAVLSVTCDTSGGCGGSGANSTDADGSITAYQWSVDGVDAGTGPEFADNLTAGTHTVTLTVTDDQGATSSASQTVDVTIVNRPPVAAFTNSCSAGTCSFDGTVSSDLDGTVASYAWDFGDGSTGTGATPSHAYTRSGSYTVKLTVTDDQGATNVATKTIQVTSDQAPTASFTAGVKNMTASVDASASTDPDDGIASYAWDFGDGGRGTGSTATHTYDSAGTYTITLTVTDKSGMIDTTTHDVVVTAPNQAPTAAFTSSTDALGLSVDATGSSDADGTVASYAWDFGDGSTGTGSTATHTYTKAGTYTVSLVVTDDQGATDTITHQVTVKAPNQPPTASFSSSANNLVLSVDATGSSDADGTVASYAWDFGDGSTGTGSTATHTYTRAGTYTVLLTVTDDAGATSTVTKTVDVTAPAPTATVVAQDTFARTAKGWGTATTGGTYTYTTPASFSTTRGTGLVSLAKAGTNPMAWLSVAPSDYTFTGSFSVDKFDNGSGTWFQVATRHTARGDYRTKVRVQSNGSLLVELTKFVNGTETVLSSKVVAGVSVTPGATVHVTTSVSGTSKVSLQATVWLDGSTQPTAPQVSAVDSRSPLTGSGFGIGGYLSTTARNVPVVLSVGPWTITAN